jgi:uncharacterized protein (DUF362 family)
MEILREECSTLLKVNLTQLLPPDRPVTTHPAVVKATVTHLQDAGIDVAIGEGSGGSGWPLFRKMKKLIFTRLANTMKGKKHEELIDFYTYLTGVRSFDELLHLSAGGCEAPLFSLDNVGIETEIDFYTRTGIKEVAAQTGADLRYFDIESVVEKPSPTGQFLDTIPVCRSASGERRLISMAKFKTHEDMGLTGAIKNCFGIIPTPLRGPFHGASLLAGMMGEMLVDIFSAISPVPFALTDAVVGMEGRGPLEGNARKMGLIVASGDCVAHDAVMAALVGIDPMDIPVVKIAHESGLGQGVLENIELRGVPLDSVRIDDWDMYHYNRYRSKPER